MLKRYASMLVTVVIVMAWLLGACSPAVATPQPQVKATEPAIVTEAPAACTPVTVTFWKAPHSDKEAEIWKPIIADFETQNPCIKIEHAITPWDTWDEKFTAGFASDTPPDVSYMVDWWSAKYAMNNQFADLDQMGWSVQVKDGYDPSVWSIPNIQGHQYGVPFLLVPRMIFYNKDIFEAAGLPEPTNDWTWDDFMDIAKKLTTGDQYGYVYPATYAGRGYQDYLSWLYSAGGQMISDDQTTAAFNSPEGKASLQFVVDMFNNKIVPPSGQYDDVTQEDLFMRGKAGMAMMRALAISQIRKDYPNLNYGLVLPPKGAAGQFTFADWGYYAVAERSQHKEEAWTWVKYITSKEVATEYLTAVGLFPARNDTTMFADDPEYKLFMEYTPHSKGIPINPHIAEVFQVMWSEAEKAILGLETVDEAMSIAEKNVNDALK